MKRPGLLRREAQVRANVPEVFSYKTVLYIGARRSRMQLVDLFHEAGYAIDVIEIYPPNVEALKATNADRRWFREILQGDVRESEKFALDPYDVVVWWHGPEHVSKHELPGVIKGLMALTKKVLILGCPFGQIEQGISYGNVHETHSAYLYPEDFTALGFLANTIGPRDKGGSNIMAWWRRPE